jgi:hypothetical protein
MFPPNSADARPDCLGRGPDWTRVAAAIQRDGHWMREGGGTKPIDRFAPPSSIEVVGKERRILACDVNIYKTFWRSSQSFKRSLTTNIAVAKAA